MRNNIITVVIGSVITALGVGCGGGGSSDATCEEVSEHYAEVAPANMKKLFQDKKLIIKACQEEMSVAARNCVMTSDDFKAANECQKKHPREFTAEEKAKRKVAELKAKAEREELMGPKKKTYKPYRKRKKLLTQKGGNPVTVTRTEYNYMNKPHLVRVSLLGVDGARVRVAEGSPVSIPEWSGKRDAEGGSEEFGHTKFGFVALDASGLKPGIHKVELIVYTDDAEATVPVEIAVGDQLVVTRNEHGGWMVSCLGKKYSCKGSFIYGKLRIEAPKGTVVTLGNQKATTDENGKAEIAIDMAAHLSTPMAELDKLSLPMSLTFPEGKLERVVGAAPLGAERWPSLWLSRIGKKGKKLPGEAAYTGKARAMWATGKGFYGDPKSVLEVDLIAKGSTSTRKRSCGRFRARSGGSTVRYYVKAETERWKVIDRRTGKRIASKTFRARFPKCPRTITRGESADVNYANQEAIKAWLTKAFNKAKGA
jgi:hypothetical protein